MADRSPNETVRRLAAIARQAANAGPAEQFSVRFPLLDQVVHVQVEMLRADEMFVQVGNDAVGPVFADRVEVESPVYPIVAEVVAKGIEHYLVQQLARARRPDNLVELPDEGDVNSLPEVLDDE